VSNKRAPLSRTLGIFATQHQARFPRLNPALGTELLKNSFFDSPAPQKHRWEKPGQQVKQGCCLWPVIQTCSEQRHQMYCRCFVLQAVMTFQAVLKTRTWSK